MLVAISCSKNDDQTQEVESAFSVSSPVVGADSVLPVTYTCDSLGISPPIRWSGNPAATKWFVVVMDHLTPDNTYKWYWILYDIPPGTSTLPENVSGIGTFGTNSVNDRTEYAPPCSQGPGRKDYVITVYALSEKVVISVPPEQVTREVILDAIKGITIGTATMTVCYSREVK
jgi:phosphatidylethanolamine-binding protein (PEBP) family uncharacterized protein